ncbi:MAG: transcription termination/antitermination protein NusG [Spirochaetaceae bacterium]|jgi:transcriptional antiterminator NusG|nr:transcription termination/antitermination protein NusG [Spirochaetaceae bacterium]
MASSWYVLQVYSGHEDRIEKKLRGMIESGELDKSILRDVKVPIEETTEIRDGKKRTLVKKVLPGYILLSLDLSEDNWKGICGAIRHLDAVSGFVGGSLSAQAGAALVRKPRPLSADEARAILARSGEFKGDRVSRTHISFSANEQVKITDGPFESFTGTIDEVNNEKNKLKVMVGIFGRSTPVEVDFTQVEKV